MEKAILRNNIGEILRLLRIANDLSICDLSEKTKISKSYITEIEKGMKIPSEKILKKYSIGLQIPEDTLSYLLNNYSRKNLPYKRLLLKILKKISEL